MSDVPSRTTVDISQIAEIVDEMAGLGRSAVGNWRKRHPDFPVSDSSGRFDLTEVERWLIENGKINSRVPARFALWSLIDSTRSFGLQEDATTSLLASLLVYLETCDVSLHSGSPQAVEVTVNENDQWKRLLQSPIGAVGEELHRAASSIERENAELDGLLVNGLSIAASLPNDLLVLLIEKFEASTVEGTPRFALFNTVIRRARRLDRFRGEHSTPPDIAELMIQLAGQAADTVCDLACGEGGLLSSASLSLQSRGSKSVKLIGYDIDEDALRIAKSRFLLQGVVADLRHEDSFQVPQEELPQADIVLLDPPLGLADWGDADIYLDQRWRFGAPPRTNADLAWMQLAIQCLSDSGVAVVGTSPGTASHRSGREADIRKAMLEEGVIKAVIQLPSRMRAETSIPIFLWVLQPPRPGAGSVMLVDASTLGTASRSQHNFDSGDISRIAQALQAFEAGKVEDEEIAQIVGIPEIIENDAILEPRMYQPISEVDIEGVHRRTEELRAKLSDAAGVTAGLVEQVLVSRKGKEDATSTSTRSLEEVAEIHLGTGGAELDTDEGTPMIGDREDSADGASQPRNAKNRAASRQVVHIQEKDVVVALRGYAGKSPFGTRQEGEQLLKIFQSSDDAGTSILATGDHEGAVLRRGYALIRPIGDEVTATWVYLWTQSSQFSDQVSRSTTGVAIPSLSSRALRAFTIPIPTTEQLTEAEQLLGRFDDALEKVAELQSDLTELRALEVELVVAHDAGTE